MRAIIALAMIGAVALTSSCNRHAGAATYKYLQQVDLVRKLVDRENQEEIPALVRIQDSSQLRKVMIRTGVYGKRLMELPSEDVDWEAMRYKDNILVFVNSLGYLCRDTGILLDKVEVARRMNPEYSDRLPNLKEILGHERGDTIVMVNTLMKAFDTRQERRYINAGFLQPFLFSVEADLGLVVGNKDNLDDKAEEAQRDLALRFPGYQWVLPGIL